MGSVFRNTGEGPQRDLRSSLGGAGGKHSTAEKRRGEVAKTFDKLKLIINLLPFDSKRRLGNQAELIRKNPEAAIEIIRDEIEAQRAILDLLNNPISTDDALDMLDDLFPKETVH
jgi:hypothetical protein